MAIKTGLERVAQAVRWLSLAWSALVVFLALGGAFGEWENALILAGAGLVPSGVGLLVAWVIDGFAKREG